MAVTAMARLGERIGQGPLKPKCGPEGTAMRLTG
jgi:hypothetical protein